MFKKLFRSPSGAPGQRELARLSPLVDQINALETDTQALSDDDLRNLTRQFQQRLSDVTAEGRDQVATLQSQVDREQNDDERRALRLQIDRIKADLDKEERRILDDILPQAFAAVREASIRTTGMRHFDVQLIGGIVLHRNRIAEMRTGEGKTLVATLPLYLNGLTGRGVHLVTPNDYLSKLGALWMGPIYHLLGLSVGVIQSMGVDPSMASFRYDPDYPAADDRYQHLRPCARAEAYTADIVYGTNNEFGFDYLRDNMVGDLQQCVQRELYYAIVDEVDNILIDEARTPLIISGEAEESTRDYERFARIVRGLRREADYIVDEKERVVEITEEGISKVERALGIGNLYDDEHSELTPYLDNALKAHALFTRDRNYVVSPDKQVIIVDEFTGRLMYGRRYSAGLHQAIEAKEGVRVQRESLTMATITFQNYFRMYRRLAGMTGTAATEEEEFLQIYNLDVSVIPTNKPMIREDAGDQVYKNGESKFHTIVSEIKARHATGQPILVGTLAIETSEMLSDRLTREGVRHEVLNAKQHEREAIIIAQAGRSSAVTIATNMAGRGVDILLGGNPEGLARDLLRRQGADLTALDPAAWEEAYDQAKAQCAADRERVVALGGLHVIGTERFEARRIDNQLRGRAGRQGDPGSSRFYVALDDDLMRRFGGPTVSNLMERLGVEEDIPIEHNMVSKAIENAQVRVEGHNFDMRKHILEYDDVMNQQRRVIYDQRRLVLSEENLRPVVMDILHDQLVTAVDAHTSERYAEDWNLKALHAQVARILRLPPAHSPATWAHMTAAEIKQQVLDLCEAAYQEQEKLLGVEQMRQVERIFMLRIIDHHWVRHLTALDELREGIGLRAFGQRNPLVEYKREAFTAFDQLLQDIKRDIANMILGVRLQKGPLPASAPRPTHFSGASGGSAGSQRPAVKHKAKVGRNDPCPCGSGKKFKNCCLLEGLSPEEAAAKANTSARAGKAAPRR